MKKVNKILSIILAILMVISIIPLTASAAAPTSGTCGENVTWEFDKSTGTLTFSGTGPMNNIYHYYWAIPWISYQDDIKNVVISDGIYTIVNYAFYNCDNLVNITLPNTLTSIGYHAFEECDGLTNITIPDSVITIGGYAFSCCRSLTSVTIPNSVTDIGEEAFSYCTSLTSITISNNVTAINFFTFLNCTNLTSVTIPEGVEIIQESAFHGCKNLTNVTIPNSVTIIEVSAFKNCESITDVYYSGTEEQWKQISIGLYNWDLTGATIHYNYSSLFTGIKDDHFYKDDIMQKAYQLVEVDGDFYYIGDRHKIVKNKDVYVKAERLNGLTYADGTPIKAGTYTFDENGKMVILNGVVGNKVYKNNTMLKAYQLVEVDGDFYYIGDRHEFAKNKKVYIKSDRINGLTYADGTPITAGSYNFDENGKMVILNGLIDDSIYKNNTQLKAYQLVEVDGDYYYIGDRHKIVKNKEVYIKAERTNGLTYSDGTPIQAGWYTFDENGKLIKE